MSKVSKLTDRKQIYSELTRYFHEQVKGQKQFVPGKTKIQYSGVVYDENEIVAMVDAILDGWFGLGKRGRAFEIRFARYLGAKQAILTNSGSSANLLALSALVATKRVLAGDEVITPAVTFPTTFNPIIQTGLVPVVIDIDPNTLNIDTGLLEQAVSEKTRAMMLPHTLGNPNDMDLVMDFARRHGLYVIEDSCDALGSIYDGKRTGTFGTFGTFSFYAAHHITLGEGGAVVVNDENDLDLVVKSLRDWGRACVCPVCKIAGNPDFQCYDRFAYQTSTLPAGYDKKYTYTHIGYNLKPVEFQAAMGLVQLKKLPQFVSMRKKNFDALHAFFEGYADFFALPGHSPKADPSWFAFPLTVKDGAPFSRGDMVGCLEERNIETRLLFAGNILRHPAYQGTNCRTVGDFKNSDKVMRDTFFIGTYPGIGEQQLDYMMEVVRRFMRKYL